jgi:hypothetical protein
MYTPECNAPGYYFAPRVDITVLQVKEHAKVVNIAVVELQNITKSLTLHAL